MSLSFENRFAVDTVRVTVNSLYASLYGRMETGIDPVLITQEEFRDVIDRLDDQTASAMARSLQTKILLLVAAYEELTGVRPVGLG